MAQQSSLGLMWSNRTFQNERSYKTENMYTTLSYRLPGEDDVEDLGMSESSVDEQLQSEINWVAFRQQYFSQAFIAHGNFAYADMSFTTEEGRATLSSASLSNSRLASLPKNCILHHRSYS